MPTTQETSISAQLKALIRLQHIDTRIDEIERMRGDLPDEIRDLEDEKTGLETRIEKYKQENTESEIQRRRAATDITESEALIKRYEEQQLQVRNNREYDALTKEIEVQKQRIVDSQALIEELEARDITNAEAVTQAEERLVELEEILGSKKKELGVLIEDTKQEQEALEQRRAEAEDAVESRYLRAYERLRHRLRDGRAVVALERGAAGGFAVPPQRQVEIRQRNRIVVCEHTGRIIVDEELFTEALNNEIG